MALEVSPFMLVSLTNCINQLTITTNRYKYYMNKLLDIHIFKCNLSNLWGDYLCIHVLS